MDSTLSIRYAGPADDSGVARVSALDSASPPPAPRLVAELDGEIVAAISIADGSPVSDPFRPTASIVELLRVRRAQVEAARQPLRRRWLAYPRARPYWRS